MIYDGRYKDVIISDGNQQIYSSFKYFARVIVMSHKSIFRYEN
jgi:hypothetical protein